MYDFPVAYFNSNDGTARLAFGEGPFLKLTDDNPLEQIQRFVDEHKGSYILTNFSYDLKNHIEDLTSQNDDQIGFPLGFLWVPQYLVDLNKEHLSFVQGQHDRTSIEFIDYFMEEEIDQNFHPFPHKFKSKITKEEYIEHVKSLQEEIQKGNIYEVNYCQEFYAENVEIEYPLDSYFKLNQITRAPYSSFISFENFMIFCGSPERYLLRKGNKLVSEPIKGTSKRGGTPEEDEQLKKALFEDPKEKAENVMIVDLVRNDLSRIAKPNSVNVEELFGIYTFETVHQMISRISCEVEEDVKFSDILKATFPMGSMTGAPKVSAMKLIEEQEEFKRGIYSGSIGYIKPNGDFDLNVVIRTLIYNKDKKYLSCPVGGAITIKSDPEKEYEECLVKVKGILDGMNE